MHKFLKTRLSVGLFISLSILFTYLFKLELYLFFILIFLTLLDLIKSNILDLKNSLFLVIISILIFFNYEFILDNFIHLLFIVTSLFFIQKKYLNLYFMFLLTLFFVTFFYIMSNEIYSFYIIFLICFLNDTSAFIIGKSLKGPLLCPSISPNKTWSGSIGSILISFFILILLNFNFIISLILSVTPLFGDLFFSFIKRKNNVKDFSNILGSHGGILDRLDSLFLFTIVYFIASY